MDRKVDILVALETYIIFEWSLVTSLSRVRELQRAALSHLYSEFRGLPAHIQSRNHARKIYCEFATTPYPSNINNRCSQHQIFNFVASDSHFGSQHALAA